MHSLIAFFDKPFVGFMLKLLAGIATAIFGIIGLGRNARKRNGALSPKGRMALIGIVVAAVLASGSGIYDYFSTQESAREERLRSERLLTSVQRGLFPFKGMTAQFTLYFMKDFQGLTEYKKTLKSAISKDPQCKSNRLFECYGSDSHGIYLYRIEPNTPLFPKKGTPIREVLDNAGVGVTAFKKVPYAKSGTNAFRYIAYDSFGIGLFSGEPKEWYVEYDIKADKIAIDVVKMDVPDESLSRTGILSLVDVVPGAMIAGASGYGERACKMLHYTAQECIANFSYPLSSGLTLGDAYFEFQYPKSLAFWSTNALPCHLGAPQLLGAFFPNDIDASNFLNGRSVEASESEKKLLCDGLERYWQGERYGQPQTLR